MTMFKSKNTLPPLRETDKKDPMLKTRFLPPAHFASYTTPAAPLPGPPRNECRRMSRSGRVRVRVRPPVLPCQHPLGLRARAPGTAPNLIFHSIRFAPYCLRVGRKPGKKNHSSYPHRPRPPATSLYFASHYHIPTPREHKPTSLAYLVPSTASACYCATITPALR